MAWRLGVDVGGTFTDFFLVDETSATTLTAKVPSTPADPSVAVLEGLRKICDEHGLSARDITHVMHGTTVATNAVLTGEGARVGLVVTRGYRQVLHLARSWVPGGLGAWILFNKSRPMAPLKWTVEADERIGADGQVVQTLEEDALRRALAVFTDSGVEAIAVAFINAYANDAHERRAGEIVEQELPGVAVSLSSATVPEMQEYERTITTVANSFVKPIVSRYVTNLRRDLENAAGAVKLHILRSDGGLASAGAAANYPVNLLLSGPAGGVSGAIWIAQQAGFDDIITFDMGGTSTDVALVQGGVAQVRRETTVGDIAVRACSIDVRSVGAGGGSIASVPELSKALRVGPGSAGADPGPAAYNRGGKLPTVTDANVVLGYLPAAARLGGDMPIYPERARAAVQTIADALGLDLMTAAEGIIQIVNENMFGALRLVSVEQGHDPREFAMMAFGGAGPLHANALGRLLGCWPVIVPLGPGVLCAAGDATTRVRDEAARTHIRPFSALRHPELTNMLGELQQRAAAMLHADGIPPDEQETVYEFDVRYGGQGLDITVPFTLEELAGEGLAPIAARFDELHEQYYTFRLEAEKELVNLRAIVQGKRRLAGAGELAPGRGDASRAVYATGSIYVNGGRADAAIYDRAKLGQGDRIPGPAIVTEPDSTTLILPAYAGVIDVFGNILITPEVSS